MIIRHNLSALNTQRNVIENNRSSSKSMEKLATGLRINRAADEAAGLAISEKMRGQIRGLEQAQRNIHDGIFLTQTADEGLSGIHEQLQRARELTIKASNDTSTPKDREVIQEEIEQIKKGINDIANNTDFNGTKLLNGTMPSGYRRGSTTGTSYNFENALVLNVSSNGSFDLRTNEGYPGTVNDDNKVLIFGSGNNSRPALLIDNTSYELKTNVTQNTIEENGVFKTISTIDNVEVTQTVRIVEDKYEFKYTIKNNNLEDKDIGFYFHMDMMLGDDDAAPFVVNDTPLASEEAYSGTNLPETFNVYNDAGNLDVKAEGIIKGDAIIEVPSELRIGRYSDVADAINWTDSDETVGDSGYALLWSNRTIAGGSSFEVNTFYGLDVPPTIQDPTEALIEEGPYDILLQVGANSGDKFKVQLSDVRTSKLELDDIAVDPYERAMEALEKLDGAIEKVSSERSKYGAYNNRLEHIELNVANSALNLTAAESRIRDVDMAREIMEFTKNNILSQAAQAMMAQANQQPQAVLQLLR